VVAAGDVAASPPGAKNQSRTCLPWLWELAPRIQAKLEQCKMCGAAKNVVLSSMLAFLKLPGGLVRVGMRVNLGAVAIHGLGHMVRRHF
jgi:hypothetical protein